MRVEITHRQYGYTAVVRNDENRVIIRSTACTLADLKKNVRRQILGHIRSIEDKVTCQLPSLYDARDHFFEVDWNRPTHEYRNGRVVNLQDADY